MHELVRAAEQLGYENVTADKIVNRGTSNHVSVNHPAPFAKTDKGKKRRREKKRKQKMREEIAA